MTRLTDLLIAPRFASEAEAEAGTSHAALLTPLRGWEAARAAMPYIDAQRYGVTGDGTDQTEGMQAANAAAEAASIGRVILPAGIIKVSEPVVQNRAKIWEGQGRGPTGSLIRLASGVGSDVDIFQIVADVGHAVGWGFEKLRMEAEVNGEGRHAIHVMPDAAGRQLARFHMSQVWCRATGGWSFFVSNGDSLTPDYGNVFTTGTFFDCQFNAGLSLIAVADSIGILSCVITEANGLVVDQIGGAAGFWMIGNNVTASKGVLIDSAINPVIERNYIEALDLNNPDPEDGALLNLRGASREISGASIRGNTFSDVTTAGGLDAIRVGAALKAQIEANRLYTTAGGRNIVVTADATDTVVSRSNLSINGTYLDDSGTGTRQPLDRSPVLSTLTADSTTIANTADETRFDTVLTIPAGTLRVGDVVRWSATGVYDTDSAGTVTVVNRAYIGAAGAGTLAGLSGPTYPASASNKRWELAGSFVVTAIGGSGSVRPFTHRVQVESAAIGLMISTPASITVDTTEDITIEVSVDPASAREGDSFTMTGAVLEIVSPDRVTG